MTTPTRHLTARHDRRPAMAVGEQTCVVDDAAGSDLAAERGGVPDGSRRGDDVRDSVDAILDQWAAARPDLDVSPMAVIGRMLRLGRHYERELQALFARHDLQLGEFDLLATLGRADADGLGLTAGQLTDSAMVTSGAITNRLDRLVAKELVTRRMDPRSRRAIRVCLTPRGREVLDAALADHVANEERLLAVVTPAERLTLEDLLRKLLHDQEHRA